MGNQNAVVAEGRSGIALLGCMCLVATGFGWTGVRHAHAQAQTGPTACTPAIARLIALQGQVEVRRAQGEAWVPVKRLETAVCAGDRLRTHALSRAGIYLQPETVLRLDQNTTIEFSQSGDEIQVEFFGVEHAEDSAESLSGGAAYFITRYPKKFKVKTPHMNAAVEGTEFMVILSRDKTELTVLEGKVASQSAATGQQRTVESGRKISSGTTGAGEITTVVRPEDAVQWVLRYPPISDQVDGTPIPSADECESLGAHDRAACQTTRAEALLRAGSIVEALAAIDDALAADSTSSDAHALRTIVLIAKNDQHAAMESAREATSLGASNFRAWLALSYAQQAAFDLASALASAERASAARGDSSLAHARVAELLLSLGELRRAETAARAAVAANSTESHAHSILGFVHLAQIDTRAARRDFKAAIDRDSFGALPRLGLGLALIRDGELVAGREEIEIAVALDPSNALLRSYVGKSYYEENSPQRDALAGTQLGMAKQLDPGDPTPWLYSAVLMESMNRPVESLAELQASIARNDGRAVYRSRMLLDDDDATRSASVAAVYRNLGFEKLAVVESAKALAENAGNYSAHRQLARAYADLPRHDVSRVSEALQAQIRQPVSLASAGPELGSDNLVINRNVGPARPGTNEFDALFNRNDIRVQVDAIAGGLDTWGDQFVGSILHDSLSFTLGQLHYETDGFTENDAAEKDIYDLIVHGQVSAGSTLQLEAKRSDLAVGQTFFAFDDFPLPTTLIENSDSLRISGHHVFNASSDLIWSAVTEDRYRAVRSFPDGGLFQSSDASPVAVEAQYLARIGRLRLVSGAGYIDDTAHFGPEPGTVRNESASAYGYVQWLSRDESVNLQLGLAAERLESTSTSPFGVDTLEQSQVSPKLGLVWSAMPGTTIRAAAFSSLHRPFIRSQTLEPTQLAGFNQFFGGFEQFYGDFLGTASDRFGVALDQVFSPTLYGGIELSARELDVPSFVFVGEEFTWREKAAHAYLYKTYLPSVSVKGAGNLQLAFSADLEYERVERPQVLTGAEGIVDLETIRAPIGIQVFSSAGLTARLATTYVDQTGNFSVDVGLPIVPTDSEAWITDLSLEYRLPRRMGIVAIGAMNLFDESVSLLEIDPVNPRTATQRFIFAKISFTFQ